MQNAILRNTTAEQAITTYLQTCQLRVTPPEEGAAGKVFRTYPVTLRRRLHLQDEVKISMQVELQDNKQIVVKTFAVQHSSHHGWQKLSPQSLSHLHVFLTRFTREFQMYINRDRPRQKTIMVNQAGHEIDMFRQ